MKIRLDKYLADMSAATRGDVKRQIVKGMVEVDKKVVKRPDTKIDTDINRVYVSGNEVHYAPYVYYMMNKPAGVVSATQDKKEKTVLSLMENPRKDLFPAGRLDKDTEGLLLLTNDGGFAHKILSPKKHVDKTYFARIQGRVTQADIESFAEGIDKKDIAGEAKDSFRW